MKRVLLALAVGALLLGACGDDDDSGSALGNGGDLSSEEQAAADKVAAAIKDDPEGPQATDAEAECVGVAMVQGLGADQVNSIDFGAEEDPVLTEEQANVAADAFIDCVDVKQFFVTAFTEGAEISEESASCLADAISDDDVRSLLTLGFQDPDADPPTDFIRTVTAAMSECLTDEEFAEIGS